MTNMTQKRYVANFSRYVFAENDDEAIKIAREIAEKDNKQNDCSCVLDALYEQPFATLRCGDNILDRKEEGLYEGDGNFADNH